MVWVLFVFVFCFGLCLLVCLYVFCLVVCCLCLCLHWPYYASLYQHRGFLNTVLFVVFTTTATIVTMSAAWDQKKCCTLCVLCFWIRVGLCRLLVVLSKAHSGSRVLMDMCLLLDNIPSCMFQWPKLSLRRYGHKRKNVDKLVWTSHSQIWFHVVLALRGSCILLKTSERTLGGLAAARVWLFSQFLFPKTVHISPFPTKIFRVCCWALHLVSDQFPVLFALDWA